MPRYILCYYSWYRAMADSDERMPVSAVFNKTIIIPLGLEGIVHGITVYRKTPINYNIK